MRQFAIYLTFLFSLTGCSGVFASEPLDGSERLELRKALDRWEANRPAEYTYEVRIGCFCPPELSAWTEVHVRRDSVVSVRPLQPLPGGGAPTVPLSAWPTVNGLFAIVEHAGNEDYSRDIRVTYDPALGYPTSINVICKDNIADCGATYETRNLKAAPPSAIIVAYLMNANRRLMLSHPD